MNYLSSFSPSISKLLEVLSPVLACFGLCFQLFTECLVWAQGV